MEEMIDMRELFLILRKRLWVVVLITLIATVAAAVLSFVILDPIYQANTTLYVGKNISAEGAIGYQDVMLSGQLVKDYRELAKSRLVSKIVINELGLRDTSTKEIADMIGINLKSDTRIIEITAQHSDPVFAKNVANKVADVFIRKSVELIEVDNVQVIDIAETPVDPIKPSKVMNTAIGFVLGLMLGLGVVFLIEYLDNTIKTPSDVEKHLELAVIGTIPKFDGVK
ncbi:MAG: lipopolysaccharide biosynthesis protein [Clostridiales bacterium GWB2_37_7]|nr:MAG: lipopolysaccharide biosynthesis protein [Clostridiales bacterium GWB2_37_7]